VVTKRRLPPPAAAWVYELTPWGQQLEPVMKALACWGARSPLRPHEGHLSVDALMLSFRVTFDPEKAADFRARLEVRLGDDVFHVDVAKGELEVRRGAASNADTRLEMAPQTLAAVVYGGRDFDEAVDAGDIRVQGDRAVARRWVALFSLPETYASR
jgi:alkyl sulfatase BDS1-like metallo-beta-lactamase superfamily hydrolase